MTKIFATYLSKGLTAVALATALALVCPLASGAADPVAQPAKPKQPQAAQPAKPQAQQPVAQPQSQPQKAQAQAQVQQPKQQTANAVTSAAYKLGVKTCVNKIERITNHLTNNKPYEGSPMWFVPPSLPDNQLVSTSMELHNSQTNNIAYASASFASEGNDCNGMYEMVSFSPQSCQEVYKANYSSLKQIGTLAKGIPVLAGNGSLRVFLMQAGTGCVSIRKEVVW